MTSHIRSVSALLVATLLGCGGGGGGGTPMPPITPPVIVPVNGPAWWGFGRNAQHSANAVIETQPLARIHWQAPLDLAPQHTGGGALLIHYGSPVITTHNTVVMPVKTGAAGGFRVEARIGQTGTVVWSMDSDYRLPTPAPSWTPSFNPTLVPSGRLYVPAAGGRLTVREDPDSAGIAPTTVAFYGSACDGAQATTCDNTIFINTPLTADSQGNVYFGFSTNGANPVTPGLTGGGFARVAPNGTGTFVLAAAASGNAAMFKPQTNSAPALSADEQSLYVVVNSLPIGSPARSQGMLLRLNSTTLATLNTRPLVDPASGVPSWVNDNATSSPTVGPDGDVYMGVLENGASHHFRGWLLHFNPTLSQIKTPASFGWDITASIVPSAMLGASYTGASSYLLAIKYNNYGGGAGGDGVNQIAIVDPNDTQTDLYGSSAMVMKEVIKKPGPTADPAVPGGVKEWCINTMAVDPATSSVLVNSEDGILYRWHLPTNTFSEQIRLTAGLLEAYTPTAIGADGRVYAVNDATLFSVGR